MAGGIDWFRWHHGSLTDPKFGLIARNAGASLGNVIAVWVHVLEAASAAQDRGTVGPVDCESLDFLLGAVDGTAAAILAAMKARGLLDAGGHVIAWEKRQPKREREDNTAADRQRAKRERDAANSGNVTPSHTASHQKTPRGEESREEKGPVRGSVDARPVDNSEPDPENHPEQSATAYGLAARAMRDKGCQANPGDPRLRALVDQGATIDEFAAVGAEAADKGKGPAWALTALINRRAEAADIRLADRPPTTAENPDVAATRKRLDDEAARDLAVDPETIAAARATAAAARSRRLAP